jgi:3-deoxy-D-manno-octulosonic-acid transferase
MLWPIIYRYVAIPLAWFAFHLLGLFDKKAARGIRGRKGLLDRLQEQVTHLKPGSKRIWFHSSSMGEFEQAKPIIAELKKRRPDVEIIATFFSPSGYEHSRTYKLANITAYIPFDSKANARRFIELVRPTAAVIVRYDIWPNHLWALRSAGVSTFIANATLRRNSTRRWPVLRQFHRAVYNSLDYILTVSPEDRETFETFRLDHPVLEAIGDTRYDQVWQRSTESRTRQVIEPKVLAGKKVLVIGSSWKADEDVLIPACLRLFGEHPEFRVVLVPHEPTLETLERIEYELNGRIPSIRFSNLSQYRDEKLILIDVVGILMTLYRSASVAYVGGSFSSGVHNVLEPAAYGIPILFGPVHQNSQEAAGLVVEKAAFVGENPDDFYRHLRMLLDDDKLRTEAGAKALATVCRNTGATGRFLSYLEKVL